MPAGHMSKVCVGHITCVLDKLSGIRKKSGGQMFGQRAGRSGLAQLFSAQGCDNRN